MAKLLRKLTTHTNGADVTSLSVKLPSHAVDNLLLLRVVKHLDSDTLTTAAAGWVKIQGVGTTGGANNSFAEFYKVATTSTEAAPTIDSTGVAGEMMATVLVIESVDTTTPIDVSSYTVISATTEQTDTISLNPTQDNTLIVHFLSSYNDDYWWQMPAPINQVACDNDGDVLSITAGWFTHQDSAINTPTHTCFSEYYFVKGVKSAIAINTATDGEFPCAAPDSTPATIIHPLTDVNANTYLNAGVFDPVSLFSTDTVDGHTPTYKALSNLAGVVGDGVGMALHSIGISDNGATADTLLVAGINLDASVDLSSSLLSISLGSDQSPGNLYPYSTGGRYFGVTDGTNISLWKVESIDALINSLLGSFQAVIHTAAAPYYSRGTVNLASVSGFIFGMIATAAHNSNVCMLSKLGTMEIIGGGATYKSNFNVGVAQASTMATGICKDQRGFAEGQYIYNTNVQIGKTGYTTNFDSTGQAFSFAKAYSVGDLFIAHNIPSGTLTLLISGQSGDTIVLDATTINGGDYHNFELSSTIAVSSEGLMVVDCAVTLTNNAGAALGGVTFSGCEEIANSIDMSGGNNINRSVSATAITVTTQAEFENLQNCAFSDNSALSIKITGNHGGQSWSGAGMTVSGGQGLYDVEYTGTGTLTLQMDSGSGWQQSRALASGGGTLTITTPDIGIVFTNLVAGSYVIVVPTGEQGNTAWNNRLFYTASSGTSETWVASSQTTVDLVIQQVGYYQIRRTGVVVGASQITFDAQQAEQADRAYETSSGLLFGTNVSANLVTKQFGLTVASTVQNFYSYCVELWISFTGTTNYPFPIRPFGPDSFNFIDGWGFDNQASINQLSRDGMRWTSPAGVLRASWAAIKQEAPNTDLSGMTSEYQQVDGAAPADALVAGEFDQLIPIYADAVLGNFDYSNWLILKNQVNGYYQGVVDVVAQYGTLDDRLYTVAYEPMAIPNFTVGDPALLNPPAIVDHGATPISMFGKSWSIVITDSAAGNSGENIQRWINYESSLDGAWTAITPNTDRFNLPDMVYDNGSKFKTLRGEIIGSAGATLKGVLVLQNDGVTPHADFDLFESDDGTTYSSVLSSISITGMPTDGNAIRLQIINETGRTAPIWATGQPVTAGDYILRSTGTGTETVAGLFFVAQNSGTTHATIEPTWDTTPGNTTTDNDITWTCRAIQFYSGDPVSDSYNASYVDGEEFTAGDTARIRFAELNAATSFKYFSQNVIVSGSGFSSLVDEIAEAVYADNGVDGSGAAVVAKFLPDWTDLEVDLQVAQNFTAAEAFAYFCLTQTMENGIHLFWRGVNAKDTGNYEILSSVLNLKFDNLTTTNLRQTDSARIYRSDGAYPVKNDGVTTGGGGIDLNWQNQVHVVETGVSGVTLQDIDDFALAAKNAILGAETYP